MVKSDRTRFARCAGLLAAAVGVSACHYVKAPEPAAMTDATPKRAASYAAEKEAMVARLDDEMNDLVARYTGELTSIRDHMMKELDRIEPPARLVAVDRTLRAYGAAAEERYVAEIDRLVESAVEQTVAIVGRERRLDKPEVTGTVEIDAWELARKVGGVSDGGSGYGFESGVAELDERAAVTIELLQGIADIEGLRDLGEIRKAEVLGLSRYFKHDITEDELEMADPGLAARLIPAEQAGLKRVGRVGIYRSEVLEDRRFRQQDSFGVVVSFTNDRLPDDVEPGLVQASRFRIVRGGMIVQDFGWRLDPQAPGRDGRLPNNRDLIDPRFLASETMYPAVNVDHSLFEQLRDFQVVYDYKTAVVDERRRRVLGALSWQITWIVSHTGQVRLLDSAAPSYDPVGEIVQRLISGGDAPPLPGRSEPTTTDLSPQRYIPVEPAVQPMTRDLGDGRRGVIATTTGADRLRVSADGRRFLARNRYVIVASEARFHSYHDGVRGRFVLRITDVAEGSPLVDLGFRRHDDIHSINGVEIRDFQDLWTYFSENPRLDEYRVRINRHGAIRELVFAVEGVPRSADQEPETEAELTAEMVERLNRLFGQSQGDR